MAAPRRDTRGIVEARELFSRVAFRRREPTPELRPFVEHYWLVDWDLPEPYATHVVPHPSVNMVFQHYGDAEPWGEVAGIGLKLFTQKLTGRGRVCGVQFRPGGFRPFAPGRPVSQWTGRRVPLGGTRSGAVPAGTTGAGSTGTRTTGAGSTGTRTTGAGTNGAEPPPSPLTEPADGVRAVVGPEDENARVAALDAYLLGLGPHPSAVDRALRAVAVVDRARTDRSIRRVAELASAEGVSARSLQRLFADEVGVGPKWVILRYRIHEALERAESGGEPDWASLAGELGYSDQAHLVRDFTATVGVPPTAYARPAAG
ncbi:helix-turn-helix domain-containing protein [Streptomyces genisteinicus]|uniref:AraC family transcriptional regulator n=1 Tax=Streptomyces genisteinicus TaxID=2768068 RepID=A0A7H0HVR3_9ACTN|nr:AraC family transcriptional regulator [Streptomyces genisteinicus]QNP64629.1 AraC family transcriptional regulator [Streptomyces genisteinicus]